MPLALSRLLLTLDLLARGEVLVVIVRFLHVLLEKKILLDQVWDLLGQLVVGKLPLGMLEHGIKRLEVHPPRLLHEEEHEDEGDGIHAREES